MSVSSPGAVCCRSRRRLDWSCCRQSFRSGESQSAGQQRFLQRGWWKYNTVLSRRVLVLFTFVKQPRGFSDMSDILNSLCPVQQPSSFAQARRIIKSDGIGLRGLNKGLTSTLGRHGVFNMIYFGFYFNVKDAIPTSPVICHHNLISHFDL